MTKLKKILKKKKIKGKDLAAQVGVLPNNVSHHVQNGVKTIRVAKRYAKALGCDPLDIIEI